MKANLMTTTAAVLIGLAGAAYAQQTPVGTTSDSTRPQSQAGDGTGAAGATSETSRERVRSYRSSTANEPFTGSVAGGMSADELLGKDVVDADGESVGEVTDLIIGDDGTVQQAVVSYGGMLGFNEKTSAVDLDDVTLDGPDGDVKLSITRAQVDELPDYERDDDGWFRS